MTLQAKQLIIKIDCNIRCIDETPYRIFVHGYNLLKTTQFFIWKTLKIVLISTYYNALKYLIFARGKGIRATLHIEEAIVDKNESNDWFTKVDAQNECNIARKVLLSMDTSSRA